MTSVTSIDLSPSRSFLAGQRIPLHRGHQSTVQEPGAHPRVANLLDGGRRWSLGTEGAVQGCQGGPDRHIHCHQRQTYPERRDGLEIRSCPIVAEHGTKFATFRNIAALLAPLHWP